MKLCPICNRLYIIYENGVQFCMICGIIDEFFQTDNSIHLTTHLEYPNDN